MTLAPDPGGSGERAPRWRSYFVSVNVFCAFFSLFVINCESLPPTTRCAAILSLMTNVVSIELGRAPTRDGYLYYIVASLLIFTLHTHDFILSLVGEFPRRLGAFSLAACVVLSPAVYAASVLAGRAWVASRLGAACSFVSLVLACALMSVGASLGSEDEHSSLHVIVASSFELADSFFGIPIFLFGWNKLLRVHAAWSTVSAVMLVFGALAALRGDEYVFAHCKNGCTDKAILATATLSAITCVTSAADVACSAVMILKEMRVSRTGLVSGSMLP